jgi:translation initiation factor 2 alpha subunit (eIF-2alpha)
MYYNLLIKIITSNEFSTLYLKFKHDCKEQNYTKLVNYIKDNLKCKEDENELYICICNEYSKKYEELITNFINSKKFYKIFYKYNKHNCKYYDELLNYINEKIKCMYIDCCSCMDKYLPKTIA